MTTPSLPPPLPLPPYRHNEHIASGQTAAAASAAVRRAVAPVYIREARDMLEGRVMWRKVANMCEATAKILAGAASVLAFAATSFENPSLSFVAGCTNTIGLVLLLFGNYSSKESRERTHQLNAILAAVGVTPMPDIAVDVTHPTDPPGVS